MSSDATTITLIVLIGLGLIALVVLRIVIGRRRNRHQARLDRAFERAREADLPE